MLHSKTIKKEKNTSNILWSLLLCKCTSKVVWNSQIRLQIILILAVWCQLNECDKWVFVVGGGGVVFSEANNSVQLDGITPWFKRLVSGVQKCVLVPFLNPHDSSDLTSTPDLKNKYNKLKKEHSFYFIFLDFRVLLNFYVCNYSFIS